MPRPALTEEQRQHTRQTIREAAAKLYADNGINNITIRAVAKLAGVSVGTVYAHFGSLSELLQSLWRRPVRRLVQHMLELKQSTTDPEQQLRLLLQAYVQFSEQQPLVFRNAFLFVRPTRVAAPEQVSLDRDEFFCLFSETIARAQQTQHFRSGDPNHLTQLMLSAVHGALALPINLHRLALYEGTEIAEHAITAQLQWRRSQ